MIDAEETILKTMHFNNYSRKYKTNSHVHFLEINCTSFQKVKKKKKKEKKNKKQKVTGTF